MSVIGRRPMALKLTFRGLAGFTSAPTDSRGGARDGRRDGFTQSRFG